MDEWLNHPSVVFLVVRFHFCLFHVSYNHLLIYNPIYIHDILLCSTIYNIYIYILYDMHVCMYVCLYVCMYGMEWNGMEWNGMERNGTEWNGMLRYVMLCYVMYVYIYIFIHYIDIQIYYSTVLG